APDVTLPKLADSSTEHLKAEVKGPTLVNFFASWCVPCVTEQSALLALKAQGVRIVGVAYKDKPAATRAFLDRLGDPFAVVLTDTSGDAG
ncbi:redoxin family protein, partial [Pseudomonas sp. FW305-3-2-15-C-LB1]|uniref:redoxin family protein n=1 Tax=Pseudomonas sp. FW305-3-2-15-C-LB1 TaxID=2751331 RepID=UPI000CB1FCA8